MFDVGGGELLLIVLAILLLFGPKKIPEVANMVGKGMRKVRQAQDEFTQHMRDVATDMERSTDVKQVLPAVDATVAAESSEVEQPTEIPEQSVVSLQPAHGSVSR
jgi:TatA/E family protein of Tat protein translocase